MVARRRQWLIEQELARAGTGPITYRANLLGLVRRRELAGVGAQLSSELGLHYAKFRPRPDRGRLSAPARFALTEKSQELTLIPWRPVLEPRQGSFQALRVMTRFPGPSAASAAGRRSHGYRLFGSNLYVTI
jgi:hypothetical protein